MTGITACGQELGNGVRPTPLRLTVEMPRCKINQIPREDHQKHQIDGNGMSYECEGKKAALSLGKSLLDSSCEERSSENQDGKSEKA
jgi:hypothetical protein